MAKNNKHNPPLILVADDQLPTTIMLERVFEYEGYQVHSVHDGIAAVDAAQNMQPDLLLLDINMPGITGLEVLRRLREDPLTAGIPTILITAMGELSNVVQGLNLGADDYLRKPFHPQELLARAQSKMKARKLEEKLQRRTQELEALLRVSEELSQHLEIQELLDFILYLVADLLPCRIAAIYHLNEDGQIEDSRVQRKDGTTIDQLPEVRQILDHVLETQEAVLWPQDRQLLPDYDSGIAVPMKYAASINGLLLIANDEHYDENHLRLLHGIGRQAALAIRNAELYEIQAEYALHLEDMVRERTAELESAQEMLIRSEKLASVGRLAASIAHEINNPLLPIQINLDDMLEDIRSGQTVGAEEIERTLESVERIKYIVERLLEFTGKRQIDGTNGQKLDVNAVIQNIIELNRKFFQQEDLTITAELSTLPYVRGNKYQLEQVFMNLAINAKDAMDRDGCLTFRTSTDGADVVIEVEDNGTGIHPDIISTIFEPFNSTKEAGNGLGLFISYGIIQNHNGVIAVESKLGAGTRFTIRLPAAQDDD
jgi:two-component system, NtrC family, sensor kinase